ncbi:MAG: hypothetical protein KJZ80_02135 [Hyphomicrobiaceae bacterium]|nr:hypothetical protein [Hyphomicrobiaceae bacterium]
MHEDVTIADADSPADLLFVSAEHARRLLDLDEVIAAVSSAYAAGSRQQAALSVPRSLSVRSVRTRDVATLVKAAAIDDVIGARVLTSGAGEGKGSRLVVIADARTGAARGIVDESYVYSLRVGAQAALAAKHLTRTDTGTVALIGSGELARGVARCLGRLLPGARLRTTSRNADSRRRFAAWCAQETGLPVESAASIDECCSDADVIMTVTSANAPLIRREHGGAGITFVSVGGGQELDEAVVQHADLIFADDVEYCRTFGSLRPHLARNDAAFERRVMPLGDVIAGTHPGRGSPQDVIVAVPQGLASADLAVAASLLKRARQRDLGVKLLNRTD